MDFFGPFMELLSQVTTVHLSQQPQAALLAIEWFRDRCHKTGAESKDFFRKGV